MTTSVIELKAKRKEITGQMRAMLNLADSEKRSLTEDEENTYQDHQEELDALIKRIEMEERLSQEEEYLKKVDRPFHSYSPVDPIPISGQARENIKKLFDSEKRAINNGGFERGEFCSLVLSGGYDKRLEKRTFIAGTGSAGGFLIPDDLSQRVFMTAIEDSIVLKLATLYPMPHGNLTIACWQNEARSTDGLYGGMTPSWIGEAASATDVTGKMRTINLKARKLALYTEISMEAVSDSEMLEAEVNKALSTSIAYYADYYCLRGDGVQAPLGVLNDGALVTKTRTGAGAVAFADIVSMYSAMYGPCLKNAVWIVSPSVVPELIQMVDGGNHLVWTPSAPYGGAIANAVPTTLFGLPVIVSEKLPSLGTSGDIFLCDLSQYAVGISNELILEKSNAVQWSKGILSYRCIMRYDSHGLWANPLTALNGDTLGWAITLSS